MIFQMNNGVFGKTMENARKFRNTKLLTTKRRKNYLVSEPQSFSQKICYQYK